jgi:hypothetical protein
MTRVPHRAEGRRVTAGGETPGWDDVQDGATGAPSLLLVPGEAGLGRPGGRATAARPERSLRGVRSARSLSW